jgi:hypothetical protein
MAKGGSRSDGSEVAGESHVCGKRRRLSSTPEQMTRPHARGQGILDDSNRRRSSWTTRFTSPMVVGSKPPPSRQYRWRARCVSKGARRVRREAAGNSAGKPAASAGRLLSTAPSFHRIGIGGPSWSHTPRSRLGRPWAQAQRESGAIARRHRMRARRCQLEANASSSPTARRLKVTRATGRTGVLGVGVTQKEIDPVGCRSDARGMFATSRRRPDRNGGPSASGPPRTGGRSVPIVDRYEDSAWIALSPFSHRRRRSLRPRAAGSRRRPRARRPGSCRPR